MPIFRYTVYSVICRLIFKPGVWYVCVCVRVRACVCACVPTPKGIIIASGMIWCDIYIDPVRFAKLIKLSINKMDRHDLSNTAYCECLTKKTNLMPLIENYRYDHLATPGN